MQVRENKELFDRADLRGSIRAYVKASNARGFFLGPSFGYSVALSGDTMAVGSNAETSNATGVNGNQADTSVSSAGAAYVFRRAAGLWIQEAYVKPSNTQPNGDFGGSVSLGLDTLVVGSTGESSNATTSTGDQSNTSAPRAGAAYIYRRNGATWKQQAYVKAPNARAMALFGYSVRLAGDTLAVGSPGESSNAAGVNGDQSNTAAPQAGAVYVYRGSGGSWTSIAYAKGSTMEAQLLFGESVALTADTLAAGVSRDSSNARGVNGSRTNTAFNAGAVYTFR